VQASSALSFIRRGLERGRDSRGQAPVSPRFPSLPSPWNGLDSRPSMRKEHSCIQVQFTVNLTDLKRSSRRLQTRLSDESRLAVTSSFSMQRATVYKSWRTARLRDWQPSSRTLASQEYLIPFFAVSPGPSALTARGNSRLLSPLDN